jgi:hypothetical protein
MNAITAKAVVAFFMVASVCARAGEPISIGPLRTGMTLEELRAAAPQLTWKENASAFDSSSEKVWRAENALELAGLAYNAYITRGWHGAYEISLVRRATERDETACAQVYEDLLADLETRFGTFLASNTDYSKEPDFVPAGMPTSTGTRKAGKGSSLTWHTTVAYAQGTAHAEHASGTVEAIGKYFVDSLLFGKSACVTSLNIEIKGQAPGFEEISVDKLAPLRAPSLATLHGSLEGVDLPASGITVKARCRLARKTGEVGDCEFTDVNLPLPVQNAVFRRKDEMVYAVANLEPGNPVPLFTHLQFRLDPRERLKVGAPGDEIRADDIEWSDAEDSIPKGAGGKSNYASINIGSSGSEWKWDTARVTATCQIQRDGSLVCLPYESTYGETVVVDSYNTGRFERAASSNLRERRAAPRSKTGAITAGRWVRVELPLRLAHDSQQLADERMRKFREEREKRRQEKPKP